MHKLPASHVYHPKMQVFKSGRREKNINGNKSLFVPFGLFRRRPCAAARLGRRPTHLCQGCSSSLVFLQWVKVLSSGSGSCCTSCALPAPADSARLAAAGLSAAALASAGRHRSFSRAASDQGCLLAPLRHFISTAFSLLIGAA